jgi:hypothetical protein
MMGWRRLGIGHFECRSLKSITISNAIKKIRRGAFKECSGLMAVTLDDGLEEIGAGAFHSCRSLESMH